MSAESKPSSAATIGALMLLIAAGAGCAAGMIGGFLLGWWLS